MRGFLYYSKSPATSLEKVGKGQTGKRRKKPEKQQEGKSPNQMLVIVAVMTMTSGSTSVLGKLFDWIILVN